MLNVGKIFEDDFVKSLPDYVKSHRLRDSAQAFGGSDTLRFSAKNPFDYILWDSRKHVLYALELKTVTGKSISFERSEKDKKRVIHYHQIKGLNDWNKYSGIICGFIIEFRDIPKTIFLDIDTFNALVKAINKSSFTIKDIVDCNLPYFVIPQEITRTRYKYYTECLLNNKQLVDIGKRSKISEKQDKQEF